MAHDKPTEAYGSHQPTSSRLWHPNAWVKDVIATGVVPKRMHLTLVALADAIDRNEGYVWQKVATMAAAWDIKQRTFERHLSHLEELGVIVRGDRRRRRNGSFGTTCIRLVVPSTIRRPDGGKAGSPTATQTAVTDRHLDGGTLPTSRIASSVEGLAPLVLNGADAPDFPATGDDAQTPGASEGLPRCAVCEQERPCPHPFRGGWCCEDCSWFVEPEDLQAAARAVEVAAVDPADELVEHAEAAATEPERRVNSADFAAGTAAGDGGVASAHGGRL